MSNEKVIEEFKKKSKEFRKKQLEEQRQKQIEDIENILYELAYTNLQSISSRDIKRLLIKYKGGIL